MEQALACSLKIKSKTYRVSPTAKVPVYDASRGVSCHPRMGVDYTYVEVICDFLLFIQWLRENREVTVHDVTTCNLFWRFLNSACPDLRERGWTLEYAGIYVERYIICYCSDPTTDKMYSLLLPPWAFTILDSVGMQLFMLADNDTRLVQTVSYEVLDALEYVHKQHAKRVHADRDDTEN